MKRFCGFIFKKVFLLASILFIVASSSTIHKKDTNEGSSSTIQSRNINPQQNQLTKSRLYSNKKGTQIIQLRPGNACEIYHGDDADWLKKTKRDLIKSLNYIQFRLMVGKCQLDAFLHSRKQYVDSHVKEASCACHNSTSSPIQSTMNAKDEILSLENVTITTTTSTTILPIITKDEGNLNDLSTTESPRLPLIFPGTKWCGAGSIAKNYEDLGLYVETDKCCREHDLCEDHMEGKECKYGLCNDSEYTRSHCGCDERFRSCLQRDKTLSSLASFKIANLYFNILKPLCFARLPPIKWCKRYRITGECIEFEFDGAFRSEWQFFPAQPYLTEAVQKFINPALPSLPTLPYFRPSSTPYFPISGPSPPSEPPLLQPEDEEDTTEEDTSEEDEDKDSKSLKVLETKS